MNPKTGQSLTRVIFLQLLDPLSHHAGHGTRSPLPAVSRPLLTSPSQILTGVLRHYATILMATAPKKLDQKTLREQRSLLHGIAVRSNFHTLSKPSFVARREALTAAYESGAYLKAPENRGQAPPNPMSDPSSMEGMMGMMKSQMAMIIPNTLIMSWINAFFSGYVISRLRSSVCLGARTRADGLMCSETAVPPDHQVQEHAAGGCGDEGHGSQVDVQHQLVLFVLLWPAVGL